MSDTYSGKEMIQVIYEIRDRVTRIEEKQNRIEKLEEKVDDNIVKTIEAKDVAEDAMVLARHNRDQIKDIQANNKWAWGFVITAMIGIIAQLFGIGK
ncbi:hypothetical protein B7C51_25280 (plasmid) [Paenibacillus larvae subsp. pulvifaciens]|uniref:Holin n=1 Tax=Paenibacillus larvae subsp. pulvifaciens TaxID=1477 RepID=A0A1V0V057_9BACL|nr:hemolysin XhlA family protein [Paenibacillus larvae]ARF70786.1 hypothetical protein B7C51_25280 [Paenibacillus larvae subsp. pulvifaciens]